MTSKTRVVKLINDIIYPYSISKEYEKKIIEWCKQYDLKTIKESIEIAKINYLKYSDNSLTKESVFDFLSKIGGILHNKEKSPIEKEVTHIINKLPYYFNYCDKVVAREVLNDYIKEMRDTYELSEEIILEKLKDECNLVSSYKNWSMWKNHFNSIINESSKIKTIGDLRDYLIENGITTIFGKIVNIQKKIGQGGNSIVCFGFLNNEEVAVKLLVNYDKTKKNRFILEYYNIIKSIENYSGIVKQYFLGELQIDDYSFLYIVMKKYKSQLLYDKKITSDMLFSYAFQLAYSLLEIHKHGIIHRDLKPQNILIDENNKLNISDFGIAYYDPNEFELTGHSYNHDRLANFDFSAPEQRNSKKRPQKTMDVYSFGQILQWLVYGETHKGTHRKKIYKIIEEDRIKKLDKIIDKCLSNDPENRYHNFELIIDELNKSI